VETAAEFLDLGETGLAPDAESGARIRTRSGRPGPRGANHVSVLTTVAERPRAECERAPERVGRLQARPLRLLRTLEKHGEVTRKELPDGPRRLAPALDASSDAADESSTGVTDS
jgi:hypothetical protein